jgi:hypothetical protein
MIPIPKGGEENPELGKQKFVEIMFNIVTELRT